MNGRMFSFLLGRMLWVDGGVFGITWLAAQGFRQAHAVYLCIPALVALGSAGILQYVSRRHRRSIHVRESAFYMAFLWLIMSILGAVPFYLTGAYSISDAFFESVSACTTTGLSLYPDLWQQMPCLFTWQCMLKWLGGLHFIILLVTVVPQVSGCFGLFLSARQGMSFSPVIHQMEERTRRLAFVYAFFSLVLVWLYSQAGLSWQQALYQSLLTVSTGGGDTGADFRYYHRFSVEIVGIAGMLAGGGNFLLYSKGGFLHCLKAVYTDVESRVFVGILAILSLLITADLCCHQGYTLRLALRYSFFQVVSFLSTAGFFVTNIQQWPDFSKFILFLSSLVGGCIGSVAGGLRIMRGIILFKLAAQEMKRTLHPQMVTCLTVNSVPVDRKIVSRITGYFFLFIGVFFISAVVIAGSGVQPLTAMGLAAGALSGSGTTAHLFGNITIRALPAWTKVYCALVMIVGKMEIFSFLIILQSGIGYIRRRW